MARRYQRPVSALYHLLSPDREFEVAERVMARRGKKLDEREQKILEHVLTESKVYRRWE